jgi:hypothetical protein
MVCIEKVGWYFGSAAEASLGLGLDDDGCALGGRLLKLLDGAGIGRVDEPLVEAIWDVRPNSLGLTVEVCWVDDG